MDGKNKTLQEDQENDYKIEPIVDEAHPLLDGLITDRSLQQSEFRRRNSVFNQKSVHSSDAEVLLSKGWSISRLGKRQTRLKQQKPLHQQLEDRAWCLLYRMGYQSLCQKRFIVKFRRSTGTTGTKQIDAFGSDDETAIVIECKTRETRGRKSLQKDLQETTSLQNYIRNTIFAHYKKVAAKPKLVWLYVTSNIIWSEADLERARDSKIYVITENELSYFETFLKHMGPAGRYQILGEFLKGQRIQGLVGNKVAAIKGTLGGETFYSFVTTPRTLLKISFINHQALNHPDGKPAYQRMINPKRIKEIGEFISKKNGYFPCNILLNFTESPGFELLSNKDNPDKNIKFGYLSLPSVYKSAWIIDGQHRLYGYSGLEEKFLDQSLFVLAFDKMSTYKEADLFITINHKQKSVPTGLLVSLLADLRMGDPDPKVALSALASTVIRIINNDKTSPLASRFAMPDVTPGPYQNLTISEAVNGLNRSALLGSILHGSRVPGPLSGARDVDTIERARVILNGYFEALRTAHPQRWEAGKTAYVCVNPAIRAHLMLIPQIVDYLSLKRGHDFVLLTENLFISEIVEFAQPVFLFFKTASDDEIKASYSRKFGEGGVKEYLYNLSELILNKYPDFGSDEFRRWVENRATEEVEEATRFIMKFAENMKDCTVKILKSRHGIHKTESGEPAFWEMGVRSPRVIKNAFQNQQNVPRERRKPKEAYLDIMDVKEIIEQDNNWNFFEGIFNVAQKNERKGSKKYHTSWIAKFNDVRNIAAHKSSLRTYSEEDLEFVDWLRSEVAPNIERELARHD